MACILDPSCENPIRIFYDGLLGFLRGHSGGRKGSDFQWEHQTVEGRESPTENWKPYSGPGFTPEVKEWQSGLRGILRPGTGPLPSQERTGDLRSFLHWVVTLIVWRPYSSIPDVVRKTDRKILCEIRMVYQFSGSESYRKIAKVFYKRYVAQTLVLP